MSAEWSKNRSISQSLIERGIGEGLSGSSILASLQESGLGYRRTDFFEDMRRITGRRLNEEPISRLSSTSYVPVHMVEELPYNMQTSYWYRFKATFTDPSTGDTTRKDFILGSDDWLAKGDAGGQLTDYVPVADYGEGFMLTSLDLIGVSHKQGAAYRR